MRRRSPSAGRRPKPFKLISTYPICSCFEQRRRLFAEQLHEAALDYAASQHAA
jgi:hypothetical protein